jgi:predicted site-specific integrase-resolvase
MPKLYTVRLLAELFEKDEVTIRRWISDGDLFPHAFKVKDGWYVPASDVKRLMKARPSEDGPDKPSADRRSSKRFVREW